MELGGLVALTMGKQGGMRLLDIDHHEYLPGSVASMRPGFADGEELAKTRSATEYWAKMPSEKVFGG